MDDTSSKMQVKIKRQNQIPGFGGLNFTTLYEDGWFDGMVLEAEPIAGTNRIKATWMDGDIERSRTLYRNEWVEA